MNNIDRLMLFRVIEVLTKFPSAFTASFHMKWLESLIRALVAIVRIVLYGGWRYRRRDSPLPRAGASLVRAPGASAAKAVSSTSDACRSASRRTSNPIR